MIKSLPYVCAVILSVLSMWDVALRILHQFWKAIEPYIKGYAYFIVVYATLATVYATVASVAALYVVVCKTKGKHASYIQSPPLNEFTSMFQDLVNLNELIPMLYQTGILVDAELEKLTQENIERNLKIVHLVKIMRGKGKKGAQRLIECLEKEKKHLGHAELAEVLKEAYGKECEDNSKPVTDESMDDDLAEQKATHCFTSVSSGKVEVKNQQVEMKTEAGDMAVQQENAVMSSKKALESQYSEEEVFTDSAVQKRKVISDEDPGTGGSEILPEQVKSHVKSLEVETEKPKRQSDPNQPKSSSDIFLGVEVVDEQELVVTNDGKNFQWKDRGFKLHIPANALPEGVPEYSVNIKVSLAGHFELPESYELVSAVYWLDNPERFTKPLTIEAQHCANFSNPSQLCFVGTSCAQKFLPYKFKVIDGGSFSLGSKYGVLSTTHFSGTGVAKKVTPGEHSCQYCAQVYFTVKHLQDCWYCHFVITKDLEMCLTAVKRKYKQECDITCLITFGGDHVALDIPDDGVRTDSGWEIAPLHKACINKDQVDTFSSEKTRIPECVLLLKWIQEDKAPDPLEYKVKLMGTGEENDFFRINHHPATDSNAIVMMKCVQNTSRSASQEIRSSMRLPRVPLPSLWILFLVLGIASAIAGLWWWIGKFLLMPPTSSQGPHHSDYHLASFPGFHVWPAREAGNEANCHPIEDVSAVLDELHSVTEWKTMGEELKVPQEDLEAIDNDNRKTEHKRKETIRKWFSSTERPCWEMVVRALKKMKEKNFANKIAEKYGVKYAEL